MAAIQEPMGVTLDNDARLEGLAALRDAAEVEEQSLLRGRFLRFCRRARRGESLL
jgi:hypothetical protein